MTAPDRDAALNTATFRLRYTCPDRGSVEMPPHRAHLTRDVVGRWWVTLTCPCGLDHQLEITGRRHLIDLVRLAGVPTHLDSKPADAAAELDDPARARGDAFTWPEYLQLCTDLASTQCLTRLYDAEHPVPGADQ